MTRPEAIKWLSNLKWDIGKAQHQELWHYEQAIDEIIKVLEQEPKTGYWERIPYSVAGGFRCSLCHCKTLSRHWDYCPNCGARMGSDGE